MATSAARPHLEATASRRLVSDQWAAVLSDGGINQPRAAVPTPTVPVAGGMSIAPPPRDKVHDHMAQTTFSTGGDDTSPHHNNIDMPGLLDGNRGHSLRRIAASIPINPASERTRRESESAVDRYLEELEDADGAALLDGGLLNDLVSRKGS